MKPRTLVCVLGAFLWVACSKHDSGSGNKGTSTTHKDTLLVKVSSPDMADSTLFLYTHDTVLRGFAQEYNDVGTAKIDGYFPVYTGGHPVALDKGTDTLGTTTSLLFNFMLDTSGRIQVAAYVAGSNPYYDSLVYNSAGQVTFVYEYSGPPAGARYLSSVSQLVWDASGDVTQFFTSDNLTDLQAGSYTYSAALTYDGKVNPYRKTQAALLLALVQDADYYAFLSAQNVATAQLTQYDLGVQATETDVNTYTYDASGNPLSVAQAVTDQGVTVTTHQVFTYASL
ncbi:hypothetical protein [Dinghuibacter silviterrae]|uniref:Uncharacterized protein n=1 Tax=Dinghuibacter silviterrae TaxID=1539049 RepID=A0A4R8DTZ0_9BACT|nr:hypothetical protein [Dinghuibacter silviterrae]TDX01804.1 hypothetical protein EDB95_2847 [Dinghuibacter silviterrae]